MSAEPPPASPVAHVDDISHRASAWFALMQGGSPTAAEQAELAAWLDADPRNAEAYAQLEHLWAASAQLHSLNAAPAAAHLSRRRFVGMGIAASAVAVSACASMLWLNDMGLPFADVRSAVGKRRTVSLPDGSTVDLAGHTALNVDFSPTRRAVELLHGEAYFTVLPAAAGEFTVNSRSGQVVAAEGEFCLSCDDASTLLTVSRKSVRVVTANQQIDLAEGLSLRFSRDRTGPIQHAELAQVLAWRSGRLVFFDKPLFTVIDELQRWREGRIFIMDKQLASRRVSLILNLNKPEQMLDAITKALAVRVDRYTDLITLIYPA
ncbi:Protein FecR [Pseudomonas sp. MM227]|uniref:FecR family protein n=1 Tax=Pseudomonas sp. MM227 TaxID=3019968 RepID=UPI00221F66B0|nr:FecR domain-containing protein [Pseudomonas sp. MM227]CAI3786555.1 Protein FecR [Pseudomonas sp. MM227]